MFCNLNALIANSAMQFFPKKELLYPLKVFLITTSNIIYYSHHSSIITKEFKCFLVLIHEEQGPTYLYHNTQFSVGLFMVVVLTLASGFNFSTKVRTEANHGSLPVDHWNSLLSNFSA